MTIDKQTYEVIKNVPTLNT